MSLVDLLNRYLSGCDEPTTPVQGTRRTREARWASYPVEPNTHAEHDRCQTCAPNVNYCYDCGHHYRPY